MHLLSAKPGGFIDDEGIVDLAQDPADIVILSAADSSLAALGHVCETLPDDFPTIRLANWMQLLKPAAYDLYEDKVLASSRLIVLSLLGGASYWPYGLQQIVSLCERLSIRLIVVPGDDAVDEALMQMSNVPQSMCHQVWRYLRQGGTQNALSLLNFIATEWFAANYAWLPPKVIPDVLIYTPEKAHISLKEWQDLKQNDTETVVLLFYKSHLQSGNMQMFDELIAMIQAKGLSPLAVAVSSLKDNRVITWINQWIQATRATCILNTTGFASHFTANESIASEPLDYTPLFINNLPVIQLIISSSTAEDWQQQTIGLRARDIAMHVVLPEMDGRIISRAISFKSQAWYSDRCQLDVIRYQLHKERAAFVIDLASNHVRLSTKANNEKRIALVLANYPTQDGRIGNGVGLDTPVSTLNILQALAANGYPVDNIPDNGNALIEQLMATVTNNLAWMSIKGCWQSLALDDYWHCFRQLPEANQTAVMTRWGEPLQDPKYRQGRLMIAGIRLGETFVGIQPARGFNMDLQANYHDPDLVPPHSYLAFYFWLRHCYQIDAIIHVGKHGNLEWLPGKGTGLSQYCWPDIALGPVPHFYPFIVNDPGEGAQAKRRTQAVIIDHLMPPLTRAETYGDLFDLESLVDEYYQALGVDNKRQQWLHDKILDTVKNGHVLDELPAAAKTDEDSLLTELDTYLCDIKEAQIRNGLHRLGQLPDDEVLIDTIVALVRLPRGQQSHQQGLLHNLVIDLDLRNNDTHRFDPMENNHTPWLGNRPPELLAVSDASWRTCADTRERLELLGKILITDYVIEAKNTDCLAVRFRHTQKLIYFINQQLLPVLQQSATDEIQSLLNGLAGKFVKPGASGAPTRGRLDTLPTGRNFYSLDNRSVPSKAAWALGQKSAEALIARHLQEHGEYPAHLGLSVWGTATMRTGGDDIAQAFCLMGVKPVWAPGSQRVVDIEVVPAMLLGRPRVDVTLRVSGFFRDAFMNVMRLFDTAVNAIASYDEPGKDNRIKQHIDERTAALTAAGKLPEAARIEASYRVFGSKPGAYGAGLQGLIDEKCWEHASDLADAYLQWGGYAYGEQAKNGVEAINAFSHQLSQLDVVVQNQDNREHDILDSDDYYQFQGGMTNAVKQLSGTQPAVYHNDHSNPEKPRIRTLKEELNRVIRSRVLNPKWVAAMQKHGYKGAFEMAASVDYLFAYDATTGMVDDYQYGMVTDTLVLDPDNRQFLQTNNPEALKEMAERLLEAIARGMWEEPGEHQAGLRHLLNELAQQLEDSGPLSC